ncbi:MAG: hypothetical protein Fur0023_08820 [Bacteroidia bacterium]
MKTYHIFAVACISGHLFITAQTHVADKKHFTTKSKNLLPHQVNGFKDDCARYLYYYYVQLIHNELSDVPLFKKFMDNKNAVQSMPDSPFEEFRKWEAKYRPNLYCNALVDDYLRIILKKDLIPANQYRYKPMHVPEIYSDYMIFEALSELISYDKIQQGNVISYGRDYFYFKAHSNKTVHNSTQLREFQKTCFVGHTAIITDVIWKNDAKKIAVFIILNKPGDYYSLMLYDELNDVFIEDFDELLLMDKYYYAETQYEYRFPLLNDYVYSYPVLIECFVDYVMDFTSTPFYRASLCQTTITEVPNLYFFFEWTKDKKNKFSETERLQSELKLKEYLKKKKKTMDILIKPPKNKQKDLVLFYRNYLHQIIPQDTNIAFFIQNDNYVKYFPCFFSPYSLYDQKMNYGKYCTGVVENFVKTLSKSKIRRAKDNWVHLRIDSIQVLSEFTYTYNYDKVRSDYKHNGTGRCVNISHTCLLVDLYKKDPVYKIAFLLTYNYPGKYYSLFLYDYEYNILIPDFQWFYYIKPENQQKHSVLSLLC